jgi:hypothetical protein
MLSILLLQIQRELAGDWPGLTFSREGVVSIDRSGEGKEAVEFVARWALVDALFKHQPVALAKKNCS